MDKILFILRGVPGSGKSTLAKSIGVDEIFEADQYFVNEKGEYNWVKEGLPLAHAWCTKSVMSAMEKGVPKIAVANTFTEHWELNPYLEAARIHGYRIFCMVVENMHGKENIHGVEESTVDRMKRRLRGNIQKLNTRSYRYRDNLSGSKFRIEKKGIFGIWFTEYSFGSREKMLDVIAQLRLCGHVVIKTN